MILSAATCQKRFETRSLHMAFVGMSNIGKSYLASGFKRDFDFNIIEIDAQIQSALSQTSMDEAADWMGFPYSDGYAQNEAAYLALEEAATLKATRGLGGNTIIDTTGSVIHIDPSAQEALKSNCLIVNIDGGDADLKILSEIYFQNPKPTVWGPNYDRTLAENERDALLASLPKLLNIRRELYRNLEDVRLPASTLRGLNYDAKAVWKYILGAL